MTDRKTWKRIEWTDEAVKLLTKLWSESDCSASEIACEMQNELGLLFTRNSIIGKANRLKLTARRACGKRRKIETSGLTRAETQEINRVYKEAARPDDMGLWKRFNIVTPTPSGDIIIANVTERQCRWPIGHPGEDGFHLCGAQCPLTNPYCNFHMVARTMIKDRPSMVARLKRQQKRQQAQLSA